MMLIFYQGRGKIARKEKDRGKKASISDGDKKSYGKNQQGWFEKECQVAEGVGSKTESPF